MMSRSTFLFLLVSTSLLTLPVLTTAEERVNIPPPPMMFDTAQERAVKAEKEAAQIAIPTIEEPTLIPVNVVVVEDKVAPEKPVVAKKKKAKAKKRPQKTAQERAESIIETLITPSDQQADALSIQDALREAYIGNPTLRAARAEVKATYERKPQAAALWLPSVNAGVDVTYRRVQSDPGDTESGIEKSAGVTLVQPLFRGGRTLASVRAADAEIDAQLAILSTTERTILFQTAQAYMDVLRAQANVGVNERNRDVIARQLKATNDRFRVGDVTRTDVSQSEFRLAQAEAELTTAVGTLRSTRAVFEQLVGRVPDRLDLPTKMFAFPAQIDEAIQMAETYNSDVIMAQALHVAAEQNINVAFGALLPEIAVNAGISASRDPIGGFPGDRNDGQVGVSLTMPLYEGGALKSTVRQAKYTANQRFMNVLEAKRAAREETVRAWENLAAARAEMASREAQVRAAEIARAGVRQEAEVGGRTILDALDADQEVRDAQIALIDAKRNEVVAEYALASAIGLLLPGNVGISEIVFDPEEFGRYVGGGSFTDTAFVPSERGTEAATEPETGH